MILTEKDAVTKKEATNIGQVAPPWLNPDGSIITRYAEYTMGNKAATQPSKIHLTWFLSVLSDAFR